jgi:tungstate transport system ATP-binding protein
VRLLEGATKRYRKETGATVVIVTHNLFQAKRLADRVGLLLDGRFIEVAPTQRFFENPSRPETRAFLSGEMAY